MRVVWNCARVSETADEEFGDDAGEGSMERVRRWWDSISCAGERVSLR